VIVRLDELVQRLGGSLLPDVGAGADIPDVHLDSRRVQRGDLFAALSGTRTDGARFIDDAVARGAGAVLAERTLVGLRVPTLVHADARRILGRAAALVHGDPAAGMFIVGITGTNGKTTTAHFLGQMLEHAGRRPAVFGTAGHRLAGGETVASTHTTPDGTELARLLARHAAGGGDALVLEVSSHALVQQRTAGLRFDVAVFTGLSRDHLDYHGTLEEYAAAKARLFESLDARATAVIRHGAQGSEQMADAARRCGARVVTYALDPDDGVEVDLRATRRSTDPRGTQLSLNGMGITRKKLWLPLVGRYNVENALAATAAMLSSGAGPSISVEGLASVAFAPGRLEPVPVDDARGFEVFVDYAHTDAALENVCLALRERLAERPQKTAAERGRLLLVFGCGGDRDRGKRAPMGRVAGRLADVVVVTSDNPRSEDPEAIIAEILVGLDESAAAGRVEVLVEGDRRSAIRAAIERARPGDIVLVAGKGHERTQTIGSESRPFDDREVAREVLS